MGRRKRNEKGPRPAAPPAGGFLQEERDTLRELCRELVPWRGVILAFFVAALALRFFNISQPSLWMDEIIIQREAYSGEYKTVSYRAHAAHLAPVGAVMHVLGQNEFGLRFWGALLASGAIPLLFIWGLWTARGVFAVFTALLACVNCYLVYYAQDGNYYGGMTFYTVVGMLGYTMFFRGAPHTGVLLTAVSGYINYRNHPIGAIPTAVLLGGMAAGLVLFSEVRTRLIAFRPAGWRRRPAVPVVLVLLIVASPFVPGMARRVLDGLRQMIDPGEGTLKNIEFGVAIFREHLTAFGVNFYRPSGWDEWLAIFPLAFYAIGVLLAVVEYRRTRNVALLAAAGLAVMLPIVSYFVLFSLKLNRNFYTRYFTYMVPVFLAMGGWALARLREMLTSRNPRALEMGQGTLVTGLMLAPMLLSLLYTGRYLIDNKRNYKDGMKVLAREYRGGDRFILPTRQDRIEGNHYLSENKLPIAAPVYTVVEPPSYPNMMAGAFPYVMNGVKDTWVVSAWRFVPAPDLYDFLDAAMEKRFEGTSRMGPENDLRLYKIADDTPYLYPNAAARLRLAEAGSQAAMTPHVIVPGPGSWRVSSPGSDEFTLEAPFPHGGMVHVPAMFYNLDPEDVLFTPVLPARLVYTHTQAINWPENLTMFPGRLGDTDYVRSERDGAYDYLLYQPAGEKRQLLVNLVRRDENDPLLQRNEGTVPAGMLMGVAVDGVHRGFWRIEAGEPELVRIPVNLGLEPGNHRVSISGLSPRSVYTPYFPWNFVGIEWNGGESPEAARSLEELGTVKLSPGWSEMPLAGAPGEPIGRDWTVRGPYETLVDPAMKGPAGDPAIRVRFPRKASAPYSLLTPAMPVRPGTLAVYTFYLKLEGMEDHEATPIHHFLDANARPIPGIYHANGPNHRGTTLGKGWVRRQITVPVPAGAAYMAGGVQVYPLENGNTTGGTLWLSSFFSPGVNGIHLDDPALPAGYFGISESSRDSGTVP